MNKVKAVTKSRTFWGGLIYAVAQVLSANGLIADSVVKGIEIVGVSLGLLGARNVK